MSRTRASADFFQEELKTLTEEELPGIKHAARVIGSLFDQYEMHDPFAVWADYPNPSGVPSPAEGLDSHGARLFIEEEVLIRVMTREEFFRRMQHARAWLRESLQAAQTENTTLVLIEARKLVGELDNRICLFALQIPFSFLGEA